MSYPDASAISTSDPMLEDTSRAAIAVAPENSPTPILDDAAGRRALKASIGVPELNKPFEEIKQRISAGQEQDVRNEAAFAVDARKRVQQNDAINALAKREGRPLSLPEAEYVKKIVSMKQTDPNSVIEEGFADHFFENLRKTAQENPDSWLNDAFKQIPEATNKGIEVGKDLRWKKEMAQSLDEKVDAAIHQQSYVGYGVDLAKQLVPGYNEAKLRGTSPSTSALSGLLGDQLSRATADSYFLPGEQFLARNTAIVDQLIKDNPQLAKIYTQALVGQSGSEKVLNNAFSAMDLIGVGQGVKAVFGIGKSVKILSQTKNAMKQAVREGTDIATRAGVDEATGNLTSAAVQGATEEFIKSVKESAAPTTDAIKRLQSAFNPTIEAIQRNDRGLSQELTNRLVDSYTRSRDNFVQAVIESMKVERLPAVFAVQKNVAKILEEERKNFPGLNNTILDTKIRKDVGENLYYVDFYLGKADGTLHSNSGTAEEWVKTHFLDRTAKVIEAEGPPTQTETIGKLQALLKTKEGNVPIKLIEEPFEKDSKGNFFQKIQINGERKYVKLTDLIIPEQPPRITQKGAGYYVVMSRPLRENQSVVRDALLATGDTETKGSLLNAFGGWLGSARTPEETLNLAQNLNRKVATFGPSNFSKVIKESSADMLALKSWALPGTNKRQVFNDWKRVMEEAKKLPDPATGIQDMKTLSFRDPGELSDLYQKILHRAPSEREIAASFSYKRKEEMLDTFNRMNEFRNKTRLGAESHEIHVGIEPVELKGAKTVDMTSIKVDGVRQYEMPRGDDSIIIFGNRMGKEAVTSTQFLRNKKMWAKLEEEIKDGTRFLIRLTNPEERPFKNFSQEAGDSRIRYAIGDQVNVLKSGPLEWERMKGSHFADVDYDHYVSQAVVKHDKKSGLNWYEGDRHIAAFNIRAMGKDVAEKLEKIRQFIKADDMVGAKNFYDNNKLAMEFEQIKGWFEPGISNRGVTTAPYLDKNEPIHLIPYNKTVSDIDPNLKNVRYTKGNTNTFRDGTAEGYGRYFDNRPDPSNLLAFDNAGTKSNPLYNIVPTKFLDPVTAVNRALVKASNDAFLNDYKIFSVEHWIQEAKPFLRTSAEELADAPYYHFYNPEWREVNDPAHFTKIDALKTAQFQIKQFLGVQDSTTTFVHEVTQRIVDGLYSRLGSKTPLVPDFLLPTLRDPFEFFRKATFHAKLGLFAVPQLLVQMQTYATIWGVAGGQYAAPGTKAAMLHLWSRINKNPEILDKMDELATGMVLKDSSSWKRGEWLEAYNLINRSGFQNVAGEHVYRDNLLSHNLLAGKFEGFLDAGSYFFREGERQTRTGAFYTAYREFRDLKPVGRLTEADERAILNRADLLSGNMSRASASTLHKGVLSIPFQFLSYQLRMTELFASTTGRLTGVERARLFGTYAMLYGFPSAFGLTGLPIGDIMRQKGIENGYNVGENFMSSLVAEGLPSVMLALATGKGDISKGNFYNIAERFAPQGLEPLRQAFRTDKGVLDVLGGAAYSTFASALGSFDGFYNAMLSGIRDDSKQFPLKIEDFLDPFKEIAAVNSAWRLKAAMETGKWLSKKEGYLSDTTRGNAIFMTLSGLSPQSSSDVVPKTTTMKEEKEMQKYGLDNFVQELRRGFRAMDQNNPEQSKDYFKRAFAWLRITGYPQEHMGSAIAIASKDYESIIDRINWEYYTKNVPENRKPVADQALQALMKQKYNR